MSAYLVTAPVLGWGRADDLFAAAIRTGRGPLWFRREDGRGRIPLHVERWCAAPDRADLTLLDRAAGRGLPTLDIGCGPGRLVTALQRRGLPALGVDVTRAAVTRTIGLGGSALCRSVFDRLPGEGRWGTGLLADGNLGIGGDPAALLRRVAELLAWDGRLLVEVEPAEVDERLTVRLEDGRGRLGPAFPWARLGASAATRVAETCGFTAVGDWRSDGRVFLELAVQRAAPA
ncbi:SAM-dependent methyltransferase [Streptacidiphilus pinicola]|uniref:SAM-dependent methyltransferase n=1 Tax=Streptacidiphilus pinicola TaxID=2219663 RepID=A0A2X0KLH2_9ACTN|nr:SAM-dependent methyltransferase [Streptacidiphilus pinicola]RAG87510.1 SAM-dependent methyltransferase [Streptacidiphilus pinicola]